MANAATQMDELDILFSEVDGLEALDNLEFETIEEAPEEEEPDVGAMLEAAQEELVEELEEVIASESDEAQVDEPEVSMDEIEAELKTEEREKRLEEAALSEEEAEKVASSIAADAKKQVKSKTAKSEPAAPREAIDVTAVITSKISPTTEQWKFVSGMSEADAESLRDQILADCASLPKKTREKAVNLMDWWVRGTSLSVYTRIAFDLLVEHERISSGDLRNAYMSNPGKAYTQGTANAQTGQVMAILKVFRIIDSMGDLAADHAMLKRYKEVIGK